MHWVLVRLPTETRLQHSTFCCLTEETNFSLFCKIFTNATLEFGSRCFFKDMSFYRHEFFRTVSDSCFRVTFISGSENHKSHDNFSPIFSTSIELFLWLWGVEFLKFLKNYNKEYLGEKTPKFALRGLFFLNFWRNVCRSALISRNLPCPEKFLAARLGLYLPITIFWWKSTPLLY